jgi:S-DNA-T family DNA segregation ATPase FtsK/SpoIIIE
LRRPLFSQHESAAFARTLRRTAAIILAAIAGLMSLALISYNPADPGVYTATWREASNLLGETGSITADFFLRTLGAGSFLVVAFAIYWSIELFTSHRNRRDWRRAAFAPLAVIVFSAFASAHASAASFGGGYGGMIGDLIFGALAHNIPAFSDKARMILATLVCALVLGPLLGFCLGWRWMEVRALFQRLGAHWQRIGGIFLQYFSLEPVLAGSSALGARFTWTRAQPEPLAPAPVAPPAFRDNVNGFQTVSNPRRQSDRIEKKKPRFFEEKSDASPVKDEDLSAVPIADERVAPFCIEAECTEAETVEEQTERPLEMVPPSQPKNVLRPERPAPEDALPFIVESDEQLDIEDYAPPPLGLLRDPPILDDVQITEKSLSDQADKLQAVLKDYGVVGKIIDVSPGPVVSRFELEPAPGLKASRVIGLADDIARSMSAIAARVSTIPGRNIIGVELPNTKRETVMLRQLFEDPSFTNSEAQLPLALGRDIAGAPVVADLATMPHLLIAGTTGSGKSVAINTMILSLLYRKAPEECRLILIDPKKLELSVYKDTPHLLAPVVTDPKKAVVSLRWVVREMERRYQLMAQLNVRSVDSYNKKIAENASSETDMSDCDQNFERLPLIVVIIDEMADLMLVAGKEIEHCIQRLAQMARASGIHLIMATQRPSVDVITGVIKANFPIRMSFQVTSKIDSRTILGEAGAEQLLGKGDLLFTAGGGRLQRIHGPFASDLDVEQVAAYLRQYGPAADMVSFDDRAVATRTHEKNASEELESDNEALYERAVRLVASERRASTSFLQKRLQLGYNKATRIVELMERNGVVSPANHSGKRDVHIAPLE